MEMYDHFHGSFLVKGCDVVTTTLACIFMAVENVPGEKNFMGDTFPRAFRRVDDPFPVFGTWLPPSLSLSLFLSSHHPLSLWHGTHRCVPPFCARIVTPSAVSPLLQWLATPGIVAGIVIIIATVTGCGRPANGEEESQLLRRVPH